MGTSQARRAPKERASSSFLVNPIRDTCHKTYNRKKPTMPDYSKGQVYTIRSFKTEEVYVGSTCQRLSKRLYDHKAAFRRRGCLTPYCTSFEILKHGDAYIELVESSPCKSREELLKREGEIMRSRVCVNKNRPHVSEAEKKQDKADVQCSCGRMVGGLNKKHKMT